MQFDRQSQAVRGWFNTRKQGIRYAIVALVVIALLVVVIGPVRHFFLDPNTGATKKVPDPAPTTIARPSLTTLQEVRAAFQPWHLVAGTNAATEGVFLALLNKNGSVEATSKTVDFQPQEWTSTEPFTLRTKSVQEDGVHISTSSNKLFTVGVEQPFIFEQDPGHVYLITSDGTVWQTSTKALKAMK